MFGGLLSRNLTSSDITRPTRYECNIHCLVSLGDTGKARVFIFKRYNAAGLDHFKCLPPSVWSRWELEGGKRRRDYTVYFRHLAISRSILEAHYSRIRGAVSLGNPHFWCVSAYVSSLENWYLEGDAAKCFKAVAWGNKATPGVAGINYLIKLLESVFILPL